MVKVYKERVSFKGQYYKLPNVLHKIIHIKAQHVTNIQQMWNYKKMHYMYNKFILNHNSDTTARGKSLEESHVIVVVPNNRRGL